MLSFQNDFRVKTFAYKKKIEWRFQRGNVVRRLEAERGHRLWVVGTSNKRKACVRFHPLFTMQMPVTFFVSPEQGWGANIYIKRECLRWQISPQGLDIYNLGLWSLEAKAWT